MSSTTSKFPYERIVALAAGPISIIAGYLATQLTTHIGLFGNLGITHDQTARAIVTGVTFAVGALVTYGAHHKWLSNLPAWWGTFGSEALSLAEGADALPESEQVLKGKPETAIMPDPPESPSSSTIPITDNPQA